MISGMLNRLFFGAATIETLGHPAAGIIGWLGGNATASGVAVTDENAYDYSPVFAATRFLSSQISDFPVRLMKGWRDAKRRKGAGRDIAVENPVYRLVYEAPNPLMTASNFRDAQIVHQVNSGNCYAEIERDGYGVPMNLWPIHPTRMEVERKGHELTYWVHDERGRTALTKEEVLHVPSPISCDGISGKGVFQHAREAIGAGLKVQQHVGYTFANGAVPRTVLKHPRNMNKEARQNLREEWQQLYGGTQNAGKTAVLWEGMELQTLSMSNSDAQFIEAMKFGVNEIARFYGVPPYVLQDMDRATWSNLEQLGRSIVQMSFMPYIIRWEEEMDRKLLSQAERDEGYYTYFDVDEWQRGDAQGRATANQIKFRNGVLSQDEWRAEEDDDPLPDKLGEKFYVTADLIEVGKPPEPVETDMGVSDAPPEAKGEDGKLAIGWKLIIHANGDREYVRDEHGQFAETDGGDGETPESRAAREQMESDYEQAKKQYAKADKELVKRQDKESAALEKRQEEDQTARDEEGFTLNGETEDEMADRHEAEKEAFDEAWNESEPGKLQAELEDEQSAVINENRNETKDRHKGEAKALDRDIANRAKEWSDAHPQPWSNETKREASQLQDGFDRERDALSRKHEAEIKEAKAKDTAEYDRIQVQLDELEKLKESSGGAALKERHQREAAAFEAAREADNSEEEMNQRHEREQEEMSERHKDERANLHQQMLGQFKDLDDYEEFEASARRLVIQARSHSRMNARRSADVRSAGLSAFQESMARMIRVEMNAARQASKKPARWFDWLDEFYGRHVGQLQVALEPPAKVLVAMGSPVDVGTVCAEHCKESKALLLAASDAKPEEFESVVEKLVSSWEERAKKIQGGNDA